MRQPPHRLPLPGPQERPYGSCPALSHCDGRLALACGRLLRAGAGGLLVASCQQFIDPVPLQLPTLREPRLLQSLHAWLCARGQGPAHGVRQRGFVDVEGGICGVGHSLQRQEGPAKENDVRRRHHLVRVTQGGKPGGKGPEARLATLLGTDTLLERSHKILLRVVHVAPLRQELLGQPGRQKSDSLEHFGEAVPIAGDHVLNALRKALHDVRRHAGDESEVQEHQLVLVAEEHVPFVGVGVDESCVEHLCDTALDSHLGHEDLPFLGKLSEGLAIDPLHGQNP
mmetsp:Transcript_73852/g.130245  ORF Transcript_73852/g.130245 Transcript_73852/m.130245 type:complete len:284 (+) Transcript_73852:2262-3113(+)